MTNGNNDVVKTKDLGNKNTYKRAGRKWPLFETTKILPASDWSWYDRKTSTSYYEKGDIEGYKENVLNAKDSELVEYEDIAKTRHIVSRADDPNYDCLLFILV